jgi:hypothetical protein
MAGFSGSQVGMLRMSKHVLSLVGCDAEAFDCGSEGEVHIECK